MHCSECWGGRVCLPSTQWSFCCVGAAVAGNASSPRAAGEGAPEDPVRAEGGLGGSLGGPAALAERQQPVNLTGADAAAAQGSGAAQKSRTGVGICKLGTFGPVMHCSDCRGRVCLLATRSSFCCVAAAAAGNASSPRAAGEGAPEDP